MIASPCFCMDVRIGSLHDSAQMGIRRGEGANFHLVGKYTTFVVSKEKSVHTIGSIWSHMHMVQGWK